ncbi:MAG TPA: hypothetical protein PK661_09925 [Syntrophorhabdaceae bacterium]|nr:hypothetical protein [Syntrophorhabdaceae bacterium]
MGWKKLAVHKWLVGCKITESYLEGTDIRRFTATVRGWQNFKIYEGKLIENIDQIVIDKTREIRERIDNGDDSVFFESALPIKP